MNGWDYVFFQYLFISLLIVPITMLIACVFNIFKNLKYREHLFLLFGLFLVSLIVILNPQQDFGSPYRSLYFLKSLNVLFILPFIILAPMPYIEKWYGKPFSIQSIMLGVFLSILWYGVISQYGGYYIGDPWESEGLIWTVCAIVPAFLIFLGIHFCQVFIDPGHESESSDSVSDIKDRNTFIVILIALAVFGTPLYLLSSLGNTETLGGFDIYLIQESEIGNHSVIHLTEDDFWKFPKIRQAIRDGISNGCFEKNVNCIASGSYSFNEQQQLQYYEENILEYEGKYYWLKRTWIT